MTIQELHSLTGSLIADNKGNIDVMVDFGSFPIDEHHESTLCCVESATVGEVEAEDDAGPTGEKFMMLILAGQT